MSVRFEPRDYFGVAYTNPPEKSFLPDRIGKAVCANGEIGKRIRIPIERVPEGNLLNRDCKVISSNPKVPFCYGLENRGTSCVFVLMKRVVDEEPTHYGVVKIRSDEGLGVLNGALDTMVKKANVSTDVMTERMRSILKKSIDGNVPKRSLEEMLANDNFNVDVFIAGGDKKISSNLHESILKVIETFGDKGVELWHDSFGAYNFKSRHEGWESYLERVWFDKNGSPCASVWFRESGEKGPPASLVREDVKMNDPETIEMEKSEGDGSRPKKVTDSLRKRVFSLRRKIKKPDEGDEKKAQKGKRRSLFGKLKEKFSKISGGDRSDIDAVVDQCFLPPPGETDFGVHESDEIEE